MRGLMMVVPLLVFFTAILLLAATKVESSTSSECGDSVQKMTSCLDYATAKKPDPTSDCCSAVKEMRENNVVCLCKFIQQVKNGGPEIKQLGIQDAKLDALPKACNMKNTNTSQCSMLVASPPSASANATTTASDSSSIGYLNPALRLDQAVIMALLALLCLAIPV